MMKVLFNMARCANRGKCAAILPCAIICLYIVLFIIFGPVFVCCNANSWLVISIIINGCTLVCMAFCTTRKSQNSNSKNNYSFHGSNFTSKIHNFTP